MATIHRLKQSKKKIGPKQVDSAAIANIYNIRAHFADMVYASSIFKNTTTNVRLTFVETVPELNKHMPVAAVVMTIDDFQAMYNLMTHQLQNLRHMGKIQ